MRTRCPSCNTLYDIDDDVLAAADYSAICCRCHQVFRTDPEHESTLSDSHLLTALQSGSVLLSEDDSLPDTRLTEEINQMAMLDDEWLEIQQTNDETPTDSAEAQAAPPPEAKRTSASLFHRQSLDEKPVAAKRLPLGGLFALLILMLAALWQWVGFHQSGLLTTAPGMEMARRWCALASCEVPVRQDASSFKIIERTLAIAQGQPGLLELKLAFANKSHFAQPYPLLELSFLNNQEKLIAQRIFRPDEYLYPEKMDGLMMSAGQSRLISLLIQDPGKDSTGYELDFLDFRPASATVK